MKYKVLVGASSFGEADQEVYTMLKNAGIEVIANPYKRKMNEEEIIENLNGIDGLLAGLEPLNEKVLKSAKKLKVISRIGIGMSNVDTSCANELGIKVSNTPEGPTDSVAEITLATMLTLVRNLMEFNRGMHEKKWHKSVSLGLKDSTVLIIGYGRIGRKVKDLLLAFGANVLVVDPFVHSEYSCDLEEGLRQADIITIHTSGEDVLLDRQQFSLMKKGVIILNSARGTLIDEASLIEALDLGIVGGAWMDTFWEEPYTGKLTDYNQVLLTPHISTYTQYCRKSMEKSAVENLLKDLVGVH